MKATEMCKYAVFPNQRLDAKNALIGTTQVAYLGPKRMSKWRASGGYVQENKKI
jgi:hypothetical protein